MEKQPETQKKISQTSENNGGKTNKFLILVIVLLLGFCGYLIWQNLELQKNIDNKQVEFVEVSSERDQVKSELEEILAQYEALETTNEEINSELQEEKNKIEAL